MMNNSGRLLEKTEHPDHNAFYDKIINVKLIRSERNEDGTIKEGGKKEEFVIRSDYEIVYTNGGKSCYFKRCYYKPQIKIHYEQVADTTAINVELEITNLHAFTDTEKQNFSLNQLPISSVEIHIGYFNQFPDFANPRNMFSIDDFYEMSPAFEKGTSILKCSVLAVYPTKVPPDSVTMFKCVVGEVTTPFYSEADEEDFSYKPMVAGKSIMERVFWYMITKRFFKEETAYAEKKIVKDAKGLMDDSSATLYGVKVFLSDGIKSPKGALLEAYSPSVPEDADADKVFYVKQSDKLAKTLDNIREAGFPNLRFYPLPDGDYIAFDVSEKLSDILASVGLPKELSIPNTPPAIYSMAFGAVRTIRCPFWSLLKPFQKIEFQSRYNSSSMVGYFYQPQKGQDTFIAIRCTIDFATCSEENEMILMCVDEEAK